jgi:hypothetical protein
VHAWSRRRRTRQKTGALLGKESDRLPQIFIKGGALPADRRPRVSPRLVFAQTTQGIAREEPPLGGPVLTEAKPDCIMPIVRHGKDGDDPVLAHWNYEMGKMVASPAAGGRSGERTGWGGKTGVFWAQVRHDAAGGVGDFDVDPP